MDLQPLIDRLSDVLAAPAFWGAFGVLIGGSVTGYFTVRVEGLRADKQAALDSARREDERRLGRDQFTRETLLALQDTVAEVEDVVTLMAYAQHAPALTERYSVLCGRMSTLRSRIADETVRGEISELVLGAEKMKLTKDPEGRLREMAYAVAHGYTARECAGAIIRATFEYGGQNLQNTNSQSREVHS